MKLFLVSTFLLLCALLPQTVLSHCMTPPPTEEYKNQSIAIHEAAVKRDLSLGIHRRNFRKRRIDVGVWFTIVTSGGAKNQGHLGRDSIDAQMRVLNQGFKRAGFIFHLKGTQYVNNGHWANSNGDPGLEERQRKYRKGDYKTLNIVVIPGLNNGGRCTYPGGFSDRNLLHDRCEVGTKALPHSGANALGRVTVHEVGHWLGLMHTFENGCNGGGDQVDDTPAHVHNGPIARCPAKGQEPDSCPGRPGRDPVHNFMSYFEERCWNNERGFTDGQIRRMYQQWDNFRRNAPGKKLN